MLHGYAFTPQDPDAESFIVRPPSFGECATWGLTIGRNDEEWFLYEKQDWMFLIQSGAQHVCVRGASKHRVLQKGTDKGGDS